MLYAIQHDETREAQSRLKCVQYPADTIKAKE